MNTGMMQVLWLHGDILGSASVATDASGNKIAGCDTRYLPFGEVRSGFASSGLLTDRRFMGQFNFAGGLIDMNARALDPLIGRFLSPDTMAETLLLREGSCHECH